jgi:hypothetical protein
LLGDENEARKRLTIEHSSARSLGFIEPACALWPKQPEWIHEIKHDGFHDWFGEPPTASKANFDRVHCACLIKSTIKVSRGGLLGENLAFVLGGTG